MSREIKFRVWDGLSMDDSPFWHDHSLDSEGQLIEVNEAGPSDESWREAERCSCVLMQYTGLKDKNGVEIYDGDILDVTEEWESGKTTRNMPVSWSEAGGYWCLDDNYCTLGEAVEDGELMVIGNIYEHPHLMNGVGHE